MSVNSQVVAEDGAVSAQTQFPLQLNDSGLSLEATAVPASAEIEEREEDVANTEAFLPPIDIPKLKKYYRKLERRICVWVLLSQIFMIGMLFMGVNIIIKVWGSTSLIDNILSWVSSVASNTGMRCAMCGIVSGILYLCLRNVERLRLKKKYIVHENNLCKMMYYPTCMTPASTQNVLSIFKWRMNIFWIGFSLFGLGVNVLTVANGWYLYQHVATKTAEFYWNKFQKFTQMFQEIVKWDTGKIPDRLVDIAFWLFNSGILTMIFTRFPLKMVINKALDVFNVNELNMGAELREHVFKLNKRNKIFTLVLLCLTGLPSFIILKRLIIAVFNKSFKYSKR
ncbi:hypothetical protein [Candidatus Mycoplasma haematominutum]|uniref:Uncharacterized protein n=1 Tax=Candidatus Mycoplasma haematominutum 'Birmingham 1' TaxID=1116213 RepID=G8C2K7_9MOLU|nr:hypothetical protein [Candidatus Mycoplasma haematominutum]CCE66555.1 hypothetical protein (homolog to MSU_0070) [Candidatus Mycoplasma haematominutum 'Birmingham 1']